MRLTILVLLSILVPGIAYASESFQVEAVRAFVSPDSSFSELERLLVDAKTSIYVNSYTVTNPAVAALLEEASLRGNQVILMLESTPVGGVPGAEAMIVEQLMEAGASVCFYSSNETRFNHAKYVIVDNSSSLIATENLGTSGFPEKRTYGGRGWGVVILDEEMSESLAGIFFADLADCEPREVAKRMPEKSPTDGAYEPTYSAKEFIGTYQLELFTAPKEGIDPIVRLIESADESIFVEQAYIYKHWGSKWHDTPATAPNLFLEAVINASRRGVKGRILLDSYWYNVLEDNPVSNLRTVEYVNRVARAEGLDLEARLIDLENLGLLKMHTKGVIVDRNAVLVSSINWNEHSPTKNRELGVIIHGEPAGYFAAIFECDWEPSSCATSKDTPWVYLFGLLLFPAAYLIRKKTRANEGST